MESVIPWEPNGSRESLLSPKDSQQAVDYRDFCYRKYPNLCTILTDEGYKGAADDLRVLYSKKKKPHNMLSFDDDEGNEELL